MSKADHIFIDQCEKILHIGKYERTGPIPLYESRAIWPDTGIHACTAKEFGIVNTYDLREEFPALTLRKTALKSCMDEILWIYQKKDNNVHNLKSHIWDEWADESGSIGKAYGYQIGQKYKHHKAVMDETGAYPEGTVFAKNGNPYVMMDQMDAVLYDLKHDPYSRRIMTNTYNFNDLSEMGLYPCAYSTTWNVTDDPWGDKPVLNMILNQRSSDTLVANNWNVCQYAILLMMVAQVSNMIPGKLVHVIADSHIYDRHFELVKELISREPYAAPKVTLDPDIKNFYDFTTDSLIVENYETHPQIKNIPVAV